MASFPGAPPGFEAEVHDIAGAQPCSRFELPCVIHSRLRAGHSVDVGAFSAIYGGGNIGTSRIGRFCSIAPDCVISHEDHPTDWLSTSMLQYVPNIHDWAGAAARMGSQFNAAMQPFTSNRGVVIGNDVWIGYGAFIRSGVRIADGAIVAARSVVVKDVAPYQIVGGNPARPIRPRFDAATIGRLMRLQWWKYDVFRIPTLDFSNLPQALGLIERAVEHRIVQPMAPPSVTLAELMRG